MTHPLRLTEEERDQQIRFAYTDWKLNIDNEPCPDVHIARRIESAVLRKVADWYESEFGNEDGGGYVLETLRAAAEEKP